MGCKYVDHSYNYRVWGGNVTFCFKKNKTFKKFKLKQKINTNDVKKSFSYFKENLQRKIMSIIKQNKPVSGFGAAQMLPILAYYGKTDFSFLNYLFDDDKRRQNKYLPLVLKKIVKSNNKIIKNQFILITALDSTRSIIRRLTKNNPKRILSIIDNF